MIQRAAHNTEEFLKTRADIAKKRAKNRGDLARLAEVTESAANLVESLADWFRPLGQGKTDALDALVARLRKLLP